MKQALLLPPVVTRAGVSDSWGEERSFPSGVSTQKPRPLGDGLRDGLAREAEAIQKAVPKGAWLCVLTPEGKLLSSPQLAETLARVKTGGKSSACFLIGSSFGMDESIKRMADFRLSMSPMTFPHHLARVMVLEQLYRAEAIQAGSKYHK